MKLVQDEKHTQSAFILLGCMILALILLCCSGCIKKDVDEFAKSALEMSKLKEEMAKIIPNLKEEMAKLKKELDILDDQGEFEPVKLKGLKEKDLISEEQYNFFIKYHADRKAKKEKSLSMNELIFIFGKKEDLSKLVELDDQGKFEPENLKAMKGIIGQEIFDFLTKFHDDCKAKKAAQADQKGEKK